MSEHNPDDHDPEQVEWLREQNEKKSGWLLWVAIIGGAIILYLIGAMIHGPFNQ